MYKRVSILFLVTVSAFSYLIMRSYILSVKSSKEVMASASGRRETSVILSDNRGIIYDRDGVPLTNRESADIAIIDPKLTDNTDVLRQAIADIDLGKYDKKITGSKLFTSQITKNASSGVVLTKNIKRRYSIPYLAVHTIGYLDDNGEGVSGLESAFNNVLKGDTMYEAVFPVDAVRRSISGLGYKIMGSEQYKSGLVLTLSEKIQKICEDAANLYIENGAVTVMSVKTGEILAMVSRPTFDPNNPSAYSDIKDVYINKVLSAYNVGSTFKICDVAAFLEGGGSENTVFNCSGSVAFGDTEIGCLGVHGQTDLTKGFAESCNCYFIKLAGKTGKEKIYDIATKLGFGSEIEIADGIKSSGGKLPSLRDLSSRLALANMSIGQGEMLATPLQISALSMMTATGGINRKPYLVKETINAQGIHTDVSAPAEERIISEYTASVIKRLMINTAENGSGRLALPETGGAGVKTATAQTGIQKDGKLILQGWVTGFFPAQEPLYVVTVMVEDVLGGGRSAGPVFKHIADGINALNG